MTSKRLLQLAAFVREGSWVADIGSDHAHLPTWLVQTGKCPGAIATDILNGPVARAKQTVNAAALEDKIEVRMGDGLAPVLPHEVDDIVIAGIGGETIVSILDAAPWIRDPHYRLVLQPMSHAEDLRRYLLTHGFAIEQETSLCEGDHLYTVLCAAYDGSTPINDPVLWHQGKLTWEHDEAFLEKVCQRLLCRAEGLSKQGKSEESAALRALEQAIRVNKEGTP